jgi:hypothetical protein
VVAQIFNFFVPIGWVFPLGRVWQNSKRPTTTTLGRIGLHQKWLVLISTIPTDLLNMENLFEVPPGKFDSPFRASLRMAFGIGLAFLSAATGLQLLAPALFGAGTLGI